MTNSFHKYLSKKEKIPIPFQYYFKYVYKYPHRTAYAIISQPHH